MKINLMNNRSIQQQAFKGLKANSSEGLEAIMSKYLSTRGLERLAEAERRAAKRGRDFKSRIAALKVPGSGGTHIVPEIYIDPRFVTYSQSKRGVKARINIALPGTLCSTSHNFRRRYPRIRSFGNVQANALLIDLFDFINSWANRLAKRNLRSTARSHAMQRAMESVYG